MLPHPANRIAPPAVDGSLIAHRWLDEPPLVGRTGIPCFVEAIGRNAFHCCPSLSFVIFASERAPVDLTLQITHANIVSFASRSDHPPCLFIPATGSFHRFLPGGNRLRTKSFLTDHRYFIIYP
jgi:hypothetical protein